MSDMPKLIYTQIRQGQHPGHDPFGSWSIKNKKGSTEYIRADLNDQPVWRPMETAPKDGTDIFAYVDECRTLVHWGKVSHLPIYGWIDLVGDPEDRDLCNPTHWMPLPSPPNS